MAIGFSYQPRLSDLYANLDIFGDKKFEVIALLEKRDRELEDYLSQTVNASLDARVTATENTNTTQTTQINTLNALFAPGLIFPYGGTTPPAGYLLCDGTAVSRTTYAALFAILSTTYGAGDGSTTFNLPDLRQRFPLGKAAAGTGSTLGGTGGAIDHTHTFDPADVVVASGAGSTVGSAAAGTTGTANPPFLAVNYIVKT